MFEKLKKIQEVQLEAKKIIHDALKEVDIINQGLLQKSINVNEESYQAEIAQAKKRAEDLLETSSIGIDLEIKNILSNAEKQSNEIEKKAKTNHEKAVNHIVEMIFYRVETK
ncbi:MAG: hypothetical protein ACTSRK_14715 [Promethearchaeota archaeon]